MNFIDPFGLDPQDPRTPTIDPATGRPYSGGVPGPTAVVDVIDGNGLSGMNGPGRSILGGGADFIPEAPPTGGGEPQGRRLSDDETADLRNRIEAMLRMLSCAKFLYNLLNKAAENAGQDPVNLMELLDTFDKIRKQNGFLYDNKLTYGGQARGGINSSFPASVALKEDGYSSRPGYTLPDRSLLRPFMK